MNLLKTCETAVGEARQLRRLQPADPDEALQITLGLIAVDAIIDAFPHVDPDTIRGVLWQVATLPATSLGWADGRGMGPKWIAMHFDCPVALVKARREQVAIVRAYDEAVERETAVLGEAPRVVVKDGRFTKMKRRRARV